MMIVNMITFLFGLAIVAGTLYSAVETFVLPRSAPDLLTRFVFLSVRGIFNLRIKRARNYFERDRIMALFAPISLLSLLPIWLGLVMIGYTFMFWSLGSFTWYEASRVSGSSLLTLGFASQDSLGNSILEFSEATIGLMLIALLIAYLPTMYAAFSRRETAVTLLEVRAGDPPSAVEMITRYHRIHGLHSLGEQWQSWEQWFADIEESHTSLTALVFFRSPQPNHSWITAAGTILDSASLTLAAVDIPPDPRAALCIRAGYLALRRIAEFFKFDYNPDPHFPQDPIQISREEFEQALDQLSAAGVPLVEDRDKAWADFAGWRVNYDSVLLKIAGLVMAPYSTWTGDRAQESRAFPFSLRQK